MYSVPQRDDRITMRPKRVAPRKTFVPWTEVFSIPGANAHWTGQFRKEAMAMNKCYANEKAGPAFQPPDVAPECLWRFLDGVHSEDSATN